MGGVDIETIAISSMPDKEIADFIKKNYLALKVSECRLIVELIGRDPTLTEIHMFNIEWSEHCSYKSSKETLKLLLAKRGKITKKEKFSENYIKEKAKLSLDEFSEQFINSKKDFKDVPGLKNFFKLCPPRGGFEKNGTKKPYSLGGALGYRKDKINDLIQKML